MKKFVLIGLLLVLFAAVSPAYAGDRDRSTKRQKATELFPNFAGQYVYHPPCSFGVCDFSGAIVKLKNGKTYRFGLLEGGAFQHFSVRWHAWDTSNGDYGYSLVVIPKSNKLDRVFIVR